MPLPCPGGAEADAAEMPVSIAILGASGCSSQGSSAVAGCCGAVDDGRVPLGVNPLAVPLSPDKTGGRALETTCPMFASLLSTTSPSSFGSSLASPFREPSGLLAEGGGAGRPPQPGALPLFSQGFLDLSCNPASSLELSGNSSPSSSEVAAAAAAAPKQRQLQPPKPPQLPSSSTGRARSLSELSASNLSTPADKKAAQLGGGGGGASPLQSGNF
eukprot:gene10929-16807_t